MFPCLSKSIVVILFFEVILFNFEASAQKHIQSPGILRKVIMVYHQIKFLSKRKESKMKIFLDIFLSSNRQTNKTPNKLRGIKIKLAFSCDSFYCYLKNLCNDTFRATVS